MFVHQSCNKFDQVMILSQLWVLEQRRKILDINLDEFDVESRSSLKSPIMMVGSIGGRLDMNSSTSEGG